MISHPAVSNRANLVINRPQQTVEQIDIISLIIIKTEEKANIILAKVDVFVLNWFTKIGEIITVNLVSLFLCLVLGKNSHNFLINNLSLLKNWMRLAYNIFFCLKKLDIGNITSETNSNSKNVWTGK